MPVIHQYPTLPLICRKSIKCNNVNKINQPNSSSQKSIGPPKEKLIFLVNHLKKYKLELKIPKIIRKLMKRKINLNKMFVYCIKNLSKWSVCMIIKDCAQNVLFLDNIKVISSKELNRYKSKIINLTNKSLPSLNLKKHSWKSQLLKRYKTIFCNFYKSKLLN